MDMDLEILLQTIQVAKIEIAGAWTADCWHTVQETNCKTPDDPVLAGTDQLKVKIDQLFKPLVDELQPSKGDHESTEPGNKMQIAIAAIDEVAFDTSKSVADTTGDLQTLQDHVEQCIETTDRPFSQ